LAVLRLTASGFAQAGALVPDVTLVRVPVRGLVLVLDSYVID
jgi:hypothetical protein